MKCAIHQPQFLPWLGYLQKIRKADVFVFLDNVQFRKNEFQNRNRIPTARGARWITVPVSFRFGDTLSQVRVGGRARWNERLWRTLEHTYARASAFPQYSAELRDTLLRDWDVLSHLNAASVCWLMRCFGIDTPTLTASDMPPFDEERTQRLVDICRHVGADVYLSGAQARCYLEVERFRAAGMDVEFQDFRHPTYPQCHTGNGFISHMSAVDGLFNCGGGQTGRRILDL